MRRGHYPTPATEGTGETATEEAEETATEGTEETVSQRENEAAETNGGSRLAGTHSCGAGEPRFAWRMDRVTP